MARLPLLSGIAKVVLLLLLGFPLFAGAWPLTLIVSDQQSFGFFGVWIAYAVGVHTVIIAVMGEGKWFEWFAAAVVMALVLTLGSSLILQILSLCGFKLEGVDGAAWDKAMISRDAIQRLFTVTTVVPYALLFLNSFSVSKAIANLQSRTSKWRFLAPRLLLTLRVFQHVAEVIPPMLEVWREEYPRYIVPRYTASMKKGFAGLLDYVKWFTSSVWIWSVACVMFSFEPLALFVAEFDSYFEHSGE